MITNKGVKNIQSWINSSINGTGEMGYGKRREEGRERERLIGF